MDKNSFFVLPSSILTERTKKQIKSATVKCEFNPYMEYRETYY